MEEFGPSPTQVEETPNKRRWFRPGNFLRSWLDRQDDEDDEETGKQKKATKAEYPDNDQLKGSESDQKPESLGERFRNFFKALVSMELLPVASEESIEQPEITEFDKYEQLESEPPDQIENQTADQGLLAVSEQAQHQNLNQERGAVEVNVSHENQRSSSPEPVGDVIRRSQEKRLRRRVRQLRRQSRNMRRQQADMKDRQSKFEGQLEANQLAQTKFQNEIVPKMEADRRRLRQRLENNAEPPQVKFEIPAPSATVIEAPAPEVRYKTESSPPIEIKALPEKPPEIIKQEVQFEKPLPKIETDFKDDGYRETYYERRHEVKDDARTKLKPVVNSGPSAGFYQPRPSNCQTKAVLARKTSLNDLYKRIAPQPGPDMYRQSALNGAVGGLIILVLIGLLMLIR